jgi:hypothetical protein
MVILIIFGAVLGALCWKKGDMIVYYMSHFPIIAALIGLAVVGMLIVPNMAQGMVAIVVCVAIVTAGGIVAGKHKMR